MRVAVRILLCSVAVAVVPSLSHGRPPTSNELVQELTARGEAIRAIEWLVETVTTDERPGRPAAESRRVVHGWWDRKAGRTRWERPQAGLPGSGRPDARTWITTQAVPPPADVFGLAEQLRRCEVTVRADGRGAVAELRARGNLRDTLGVLLEATFNADRLPVRLATFGSDHRTFREVTIVWTRQRGVWFPESVTTVYPGSGNTLRQVDRYVVLRANAALSGTLFLP